MARLMRKNMMRVKWMGETDFLSLTHGKIYSVIAVEKEWYRIIDDSGEDYLYPPDDFEIVNPEILNNYGVEQISNLDQTFINRGKRYIASLMKR